MVVVVVGRGKGRRTDSFSLFYPTTEPGPRLIKLILSEQSFHL